MDNATVVAAFWLVLAMISQAVGFRIGRAIIRKLRTLFRPARVATPWYHDWR